MEMERGGGVAPVPDVLLVLGLRLPVSKRVKNTHVFHSH
jgi:hypothetical protein